MIASAEIAERVEQEQQQIEDRDHEPVEPAPVDRIAELRNARRFVPLERSFSFTPANKRLCVMTVWPGATVVGASE